MKHLNKFHVECCANRRAVVNDVLICARCDLPGAIPNWSLAKLPDPKINLWTPNPVNPT